MFCVGRKETHKGKCSSTVKKYIFPMFLSCLYPLLLLLQEKQVSFFFFNKMFNFLFIKFLNSVF